ncbi:MAG: acetyl-CoA carboxylase carboxyltransferase subunit beta [Deltaproteobacteria bacterium]|nr:acetyl-CoA carboxylase carboxyltransferase subunit beta [Deltaproteobacteria bacterium]
MAWSKIDKAPLTKSARRDTPDGLWYKCKACQTILYRSDFIANQYVCMHCNHHTPVPACERIRHFLDAESFQEADTDLKSSDPLHFKDSKPYSKRLEEAFAKTGMRDAILCGEGLLCGHPVQVGVYDFRFMGGSMGSVVGEKIARVFLRAVSQRQPAIIFSSSGGARMQEGILSLMQMAKTCTALSRMKAAGIPMISVMTNPTSGGVAASYAMLGDVNIAEPGALICFAGPRVIQQTIGESLPEGFQTAEYLLEHGMLDMICPRKTLRDTIGQILSILWPSVESHVREEDRS